jgi:hypothetical protein
VALPLLAGFRALWEFIGERIKLEPWEEAGPVPVEVEIEEAPPPPPPAANVRSG